MVFGVVAGIRGIIYFFIPYHLNFILCEKCIKVNMRFLHEI